MYIVLAFIKFGNSSFFTVWYNTVNLHSLKLFAKFNFAMDGHSIMRFLFLFFDEGLYCNCTPFFTALHSFLSAVDNLHFFLLGNFYPNFACLTRRCLLDCVLLYRAVLHRTSRSVCYIAKSPMGILFYKLLQILEGFFYSHPNLSDTLVVDLFITVSHL